MGKAVLVIDMQPGVFLRKQHDGMAVYRDSDSVLRRRRLQHVV